MERIFISYAREDKEFAKKLYLDLQRHSITAWYDIDILPGQNWRSIIAKEIRNSSHFLALISRHSVEKRGEVQRELRCAINTLDEIPPDDIYLLPVRIDATEPKFERIREIQQIDLFPQQQYSIGFSKLLRAIKFQRGEPKESFDFDRKNLFMGNFSQAMSSLENDLAINPMDPYTNLLYGIALTEGRYLRNLTYPRAIKIHQQFVISYEKPITAKLAAKCLIALKLDFFIKNAVNDPFPKINQVSTIELNHKTSEEDLRLLMLLKLTSKTSDFLNIKIVR